MNAELFSPLMLAVWVWTVTKKYNNQFFYESIIQMAKFPTDAYGLYLDRNLIKATQTSSVSFAATFPKGKAFNLYVSTAGRCFVKLMVTRYNILRWLNKLHRTGTLLARGFAISANNFFKKTLTYNFLFDTMKYVDRFIQTHYVLS